MSITAPLLWNQSSAPRPNALVEILQFLGISAPVAVVLALLFLAALDGVLKQFALLKTIVSWLRIMSIYLRDLFTAPMEIRKLKEMQSATATPRYEPVHALGVVWFQSEVNAGECDACCESCWSEGKRISLTVQIREDWVHPLCPRVPAHGVIPHLGDVVGRPKAEWVRVARDAYKIRQSQGLR